MKTFNYGLALATLFSAVCFAETAADDVTKVTNTETSYPYWSPDGSRIVFQSDRAGTGSEIYLMDADGTHVERLTFNAARDVTAVWSPDGNKIAFQSDRDGNTEIYVMNTDGSHQVNVTQYQGEDMHPKWSADSQRIIFSSVRGYWNIVNHFAINADGSGLEKITDTVNVDTYAEWSPDGKRIVARRIVYPYNSDVVVMDADGTHEVNVTDHPAYDGWPTWSADGTKVLFASDRTGGNRIFMAAPDGSGVEQLFDQPGDWAKPIMSRDGTKLTCTRTLDGNVDVYTMDWATRALTKLSNIRNDDPSWSPDGKKILFQSNRAENWEIYTVDEDGSNLVRLTATPAADVQPAFSPDGSQIAFVSDRDGNEEIYVMRADGSYQVNVSQHPGRDLQPGWSPDGTRLLFSSDRGSSGELDVYVMHSDGSDVALVTAGTDAVFSPDGTRIAFVRTLAGGDDEVFVAAADGSAAVNLSRHPGFDGHPVFSPDGREVHFASERSGRSRIYAVSVDGSEPRRLLDAPAEYSDLRSSWSRDGSKQVFARERDGTIDLYVRNR